MRVVLDVMKRTYSFYHHYLREIPTSLNESRGPLDYFIWSDCLFGISIDHPSHRIRFDRDLILMFDYGGKLGVQYNAAFICWWALMNLRRYHHLSETRGLDCFTRQVQWLLSHQNTGKEGAIVWHYDFDWHEGRTLLKAPWVSAMSQGLAMSCLVRAYRLQGNKEFLNIAHRASKVFEIGIEEGGVRTVEDGNVFYEEYPAYPLVRILDGFVFGLLGLYDLYEETQNAHIKRLFDEGIGGVRSWLGRWNYHDVWSRYGNHPMLSPPDYNKLNAVLMGALYHITRQPCFRQVRNAWDYKQKGMLGKTKTLLFILLGRIAHRRPAL